jgi:hypothetical protein
MFLLYEYLESIIEDLPGIKKMYRVSSLIQLEEALSNLRDMPNCCLMVTDSGDGFLDFASRRLNTAYHTFYVFVKAGINDHASRLAAKREAMDSAIKLIDRMRTDSTDFGMMTYGFDDSRIDYNEIGPIGNNYYGYSFGFTVKQAFAK